MSRQAMSRQSIQRSVTTAIGKAGSIGHLRRARQRLMSTLDSHKPGDVLAQAAFGAFFAAATLRLVRSPGLGRALVRWLPMLAFAGTYHAMSRRATRR